MLVAAGLLTACSGLSTQALRTPSAAETAIVTTPTSTRPDSSSEVSGPGEGAGIEADGVPSPRPRRPLALVSATGVVVPVVGRTSAGYLVTTPCGNQSELAWGMPIFRADVVLDPGHGGVVETGSEGSNGVVEKDLNLEVSRTTARILTERGYDVVLTRTADYRMPIAVRAGLGSWLDPAAMVSIHHNGPAAAPSPTPGTEIYVQQGSETSARLGALVWEEVTEALDGFAGVDWVAAPDAGVLEVINDEGSDAYGMVRRPTVPAVLAELGYLANPSEAELFASPAYVEEVSEALADGIERFLRTDDMGAGRVGEPRLIPSAGRTGGRDGCEDPALDLGS